LLGSLQNLPDQDVVRVLWVCILKTINMTGKNQQQVMQAVMQKIKAYHKLLATFVTNARLELTFMVTVQVRDNVLIFGVIVFKATNPFEPPLDPTECPCGLHVLVI
jgi:hypothetical protein